MIKQLLCYQQDAKHWYLTVTLHYIFAQTPLNNYDLKVERQERLMQRKPYRQQLNYTYQAEKEAYRMLEDILPLQAVPIQWAVKPRAQKVISKLYELPNFR